MKLTILGASGGVGVELTRQAVERGHEVVAISRRPERGAVPDSPRLTRVPADVFDPESIGTALSGASTVISVLGLADRPGVLTAGSQAVLAAAPDRLLWLGAFGSGRSARAAGALTRTLLGTFLRAELGDKVAADTAILDGGGTVFHAGPMSSGPVSPRRRAVDLSEAPRKLFPASVSKATVAAAMLDEAEHPSGPGGRVLVPLAS
ncbi:NAD(P)-dependent oxidoreductase [Cryptosporangium arvum]|uniref:NmrA family protein n=1 Tax=Cryptosporangium arvum DSM 44712 TaxID=927661 RepID=A0A010ZT85_9ACTN|nr:NAD(P)H-binding protein [Cryptosporangium arvum]EXG81914.1 NmrA family protein [Cryptosporangium arvum DSM 44712]